MTGQLVKKANQHFWLRSYTPRRLIGDGLVAAVFAYFFVTGDRSWMIGALGTSIVILLGVRLASYFILLKRALARLDQMNLKAATVTIGEDGISVKSDLGSSELPWRLIARVWRFPELWLIFPTGSHYFTLPAAALDEEAQAFIIGKVSEHGGHIV